MKRRSLLVRALRGIMWFLLGVGLLVGLAMGAIMTTRPGLWVVSKIATRSLDGVFEGRVVVERIGRIGPFGVRGVRATVYDDRGPVVHVDGLAIRTSLAAIVSQVVRPRGPL